MEDVPIAWPAASLDEWWEATRDTSRVLGDLLGRLSAGQIADLRERSAGHLRRYVGADGWLAVPGVARVVAAVAPS